MNIDHPSSKQPYFILLLSFIAFAALFFMQMNSGVGIANSDNTMRLINLRDLLAGQSWLDPQQYRLGLEGGTTMHWSRLIDLPLWLIYTLAYSITQNSILAEHVVQILWPLLTFIFCLFGFKWVCKNLGVNNMLGPICLIGTVCFYSIGIFSYGDLDHHNIQIALAILLLASVAHHNAESLDHARNMFLAGIFAVLMLAIGMEALPYVVVFGGWMALSFLFGKITPRATGSFGLGFGLTAILIYITTISPSDYSRASCDAYSVFHLVLCSIAGFGLYAGSKFASSFTHKLISLACVALICAAAIFGLFPECLTNPLTRLDPNLRKFWLEGVIETRSIFDLWQTDPFQIFGIFGMGCTGLLASLWLLRHKSPHIRWAATLWTVIIASSLIVTAWQQRGNIFAASFAIFPLAFVVTELREKYLTTQKSTDLLKMVVIAIPSLNLFWWYFGNYAANFFAQGPTLQQQAASVSQDDYCYADRVFSALKEEPQGVVLGATDIGVPILKLTPHRVLAAPYHRNTGGNLAMINAMIATPDKAREIITEAKVTLIADCINSADAYDFKEAHPEGLQAKLHEGDIPNWLKRVEATKDQPLVLYRVVQ